MRTVKIMHDYMLKPQSLLKKQLTTPYDDFLPSFTNHCTDSKSNCSKFSVLLWYMPTDSIIRYAKPQLSCQPRAQLLSGTLLLFLVSPVRTQEPWLLFHRLDIRYLLEKPSKLFNTGNYYVIFM